MGRKPTERKPAGLSIESKRTAIPHLESRVRELEQLDVDSISSGDHPSVQELSARIRSTLSHIYGEDSLEFICLQPAADLDLTPYSVSLVGDYAPPPASDIRDGLRQGRTQALSLLRSELQSLRESLTDGPSAATSAPPSPGSLVRTYLSFMATTVQRK